MMDFTGKVALVTGGGAGIGRESAILFAKYGAKVAVNSVGPTSGQETVDIIKANGGDAIFIRGDVSSNAFCKAMVEKTVETYGRLDILVTSAGVVRPGNVCEVTEEVIDEVLGVNVKGVFFCSKYAVEAMEKTGGGSIVHVASACCMYGVKNRSIYTASKGAVVALTRSMAVDLADKHIRTNSICPGATLSPSMEARFAASDDPEGMRASFIANHPIGHLAQPIEVAKTVVFVASDESSFTDGATIMVDGGVSL
ncbi:MAG: glucose 1-dehydrogenase [Lachnospiraceae bacterium]|nr:glucose 1-dehydrogenase [Lachnospiraceae bacterium]